MEPKFHVKDIMTRKVVSVQKLSTIREVNDLFHTYHVRHLPVTEGSKLVGILSLTDVLRLSFGETFGDLDLEADALVSEMLTVDQIMNHQPTTIGENCTITDASRILAHANFHALPVIDEERNLVGILTTTDIIKHYLTQTKSKEVLEGHATV